MIKIICVGKLKETYLQEALQEYQKRLQRYTKLEIIEVIDMPYQDIEKVKDLTIMAEGDAGVYIVANLKDNEFFITGHAEYDPYSLKSEYDRDIKAGMDMHIPINYYPDDDPTKEPIVRWRSVANLLFNNWLNYYVYQSTPYDVRDINK